MTSTTTTTTPTSWIGDGSDGSTLAPVNDDSTTWTATAGRPGTPYNVRSTEPAISIPSSSSSSTSSSSSFFTIQIQHLDGNVSVGIVSKDDFQPGWKTKGMFYNGNVTNGSAGLMIGFGKYVKAGDIVGVHVQKTEDNNLNVEFYVNGSCLGTAFSIPIDTLPTDSNNSNDKVFYPCVHVSGSVTFQYDSDVTVPPPPSENNVSTAPYFCGDWKIVELRHLQPNNSSIVPLPPNHDIVLSLTSSSSSSTTTNTSSSNVILLPDRISIKVGNTINGSIHVTPTAIQPDALDSFIQIGSNLMSTMMMPPPELYVVEQALMTIVPTLRTMATIFIDIDPKRRLYMNDSKEEGNIAKITAIPYKKVFQPLTKYW